MKHRIEATYIEQEVTNILLKEHFLVFGNPPDGYEWALQHRRSYDTEWTVIAVEREKEIIAK